MVKSELIDTLAAVKTHLTRVDLDRIVSAIFDEIANALAEGDRVELRGFGTFSVRERGARIGRNPRTGINVDVTAKKVALFKSGRKMREMLNSRE